MARVIERAAGRWARLLSRSGSLLDRVRGGPLLGRAARTVRGRARSTLGDALPTVATFDVGRARAEEKGA
jgi:hypothetical protein